MLKPFVVFYEKRKCTKVVEATSAAEAMKLREEFDSKAGPGDSAMVVYALDRADLDSDAAHCVGGQLDSEGDGLTTAESDH